MSVADTLHAVFLSYASQDSAVAWRICEALRTAGIEVWFDRSELRGGDAWDRQIRAQIHECRLFIPIVSANTEARVEGYFRREWKLAVERTHDRSERVPFLVPVVIDSTSEQKADVPDAFRHVHWTRLPDGETPPAFVERVRRLLSSEDSSSPDRGRLAGSVVAGARSVPSRLSGAPRRVLYGVTAAVVLVLGFFTFERLGPSHANGLGSTSIAVLPLVNESGDANQQYFSDGISEDFITALSQFPGLKVIGRASAFQFRSSKEDSRSIGAKLGVAHLLEGSVRRSGRIVRVSAELVDTADGSIQWSEHYDRPYQDLFALQDEITRAVAVALRAKLLPGAYAAAQSERPPGDNLEAYNAFLLGRFLASRGTEVDLRRAIEFYTQATQLDPRYALAWSGLSRASANLGYVYLTPVQAKEAYAQARAAADRALALSPHLADAHVALGQLLQIDTLDWHGAEAEFRLALELTPNDAEAKFNLGTQLATFGDLRSAIELTQEALATEPLQGSWYNWLANYLLGLNRLDEAERAIRTAIELQPAGTSHYAILATIEVQRGNARAALVAAQHEPPGFWRDGSIALARQIGTDRAAAEAALRTLIEKHAQDAPFQIADVYALRHDANSTFAWLEQVWKNRDPSIATLLYDPFILRFKSDPRLAMFCRKVGLPMPGQAAARP